MDFISSMQFVIHMGRRLNFKISVITEDTSLTLLFIHLFIYYFSVNVQTELS